MSYILFIISQTKVGDILDSVKRLHRRRRNGLCTRKLKKYFYPTAIYGCAGIVFILAGRADGQAVSAVMAVFFYFIL